MGACGTCRESSVIQKLNPRGPSTNLCLGEGVTDFSRVRALDSQMDEDANRFPEIDLSTFKTGL